MIIISWFKARQIDVELPGFFYSLFMIFLFGVCYIYKKTTHTKMHDADRLSIQHF